MREGEVCGDADSVFEGRRARKNGKDKWRATMAKWGLLRLKCLLFEV